MSSKSDNVIRGDKKTKFRFEWKVFNAGVPIESVGTYNADNETYPITINGGTQNVEMPTSDARTFKANLTSADAMGYQQLAENGIDIVVFNDNY